MIPILYDSTETEFASNGLGRLRDCISCMVTEERNGIYEVDFQYPVDGYNYDKIQLGRIIAVEHDETSDVQPFDIVSSSKPIDGIVTFHAVHISYRQSQLTVAGTNINSLAGAFALFANSSPANPFNYSTDKSSTGYLASADGIPRSIRSMLGGVEGSILDAYGGEYEWSGWTVKLWASRGVDRTFTIRYGVNMVDYQEDTDYSESFSAVIPFWSGDDGIVKGDMVDSGSTLFGRTACVPLDLTEKFENKPTKAQVEAAAASYLASNQPFLPHNNIKVDFVRLSDSPEYANFAPLQVCKLCDTVRVIFPRYNMEGRFKIVRTVYDALLERFTEMELGTLSTTLAEALGINDTSSGTQQSAFVKETGTDNSWTYRKWSDGSVEAWRDYSFNSASWSAWSSPIRYMDKSITFPSGLFASTPSVIGCSTSNQYWLVNVNATSATAGSLRLATVATSDMATTVRLYAWT